MSLSADALSPGDSHEYTFGREETGRVRQENRVRVVEDRAVASYNLTPLLSYKMAHELSSSIDALLQQINLDASYLLYVIPVATILAFGLLIYAFGFKKVKLPSDTLSSPESTKKGKSKGVKSKSTTKSKASSPQQSQVKANGSVNHQNHQQQQKQQQSVKPKAVVQPIKREKVHEKVKKTQTKEKNDIEVDTATDLDSGDWVTVTSKKTAKSVEKQLAKKEKKEKLKQSTNASTSSSTIPVTEVIVDEPTVVTLESVWSVGEEEPLEFEDTRALKKKQPSKKSKEKVAAKKAAEVEASVTAAAEPQRLIEDKLTSTVIASYDSVDVKPRKKSDSKKPEVPAKGESKKPAKKTEVKAAPVEGKVSKVDTSGSKSSPPEVVTPQLPSNKVEKVSTVPVAASSSTDITDGTYPQCTFLHK